MHAVAAGAAAEECSGSRHPADVARCGGAASRPVPSKATTTAKGTAARERAGCVEDSNGVETASAGSKQVRRQGTARAEEKTRSVSADSESVARAPRQS